MRARKDHTLIALFVVILILIASEPRFSPGEWLITFTSLNEPLPSPPDDGYEGLTSEEIGAAVFKANWCLHCHNLDLQGGCCAHPPLH